MKIQEDEVLEQRFFSSDKLPEELDPLNKDIILRVFAMLQS